MIIVCLIVFVFASYKLIDITFGYYKNNQVINEVKNKFYQNHSTFNDQQQDVYDPDVMPKNTQPNFEQLLSDNKDVKGWIKIGDTKIDYPIVQGADNETYLTKNYYKEYSPAGSIFLDFRNNIDTLDDNTVIYGHRMKDGSMFEPLMHYTDENFYKQNPIIELKTLYGNYEAEVFAAYKTTTDFDYIQTDFSSKKQYKQFLNEINKKSLLHSDITIDENDKIITLSTCDYTLDAIDGRFAVHAKLVEK